jgi:hypothetical protein
MCKGFLLEKLNKRGDLNLPPKWGVIPFEDILKILRTIVKNSSINYSGTRGRYNCIFGIMF